MTEQQKEYAQRYRLRHPDRVIASLKRYKDKHREKVRHRCNTWMRTIKGRWRTLGCVARKRDLECNLTLEEFTQLISCDCCVYCEGKLNETGGGLDRLDNTKGYIQGNVVPCCRACNSIRNDFLTYDEMISISSVLKKSRLRRENEKLCEKY